MDSKLGAIVLCGGESSRMGRDKAWLPFGDETLLARTVRLVATTIPHHNIVIVAGPEQELPSLPTDVRLVRDMAPGRGPLPAMLAGLLDLPETVDAAFVTGCDAPLLLPTVIDWMFWRLSLAPAADAPDYYDAVVPFDGAHLHPLCATYRTSCRVGVAAAAMAGVTSLHGIVQNGMIRARRVSHDEIRRIDPELDSLVNCNTPEEYEWALDRARET